MTIKKEYNTIVSQAKKGVPGFAIAYAKFIEKVTINQSSKSLIVNYSRSLAYAAFHFGRCPHLVSVEELNSYLYRMMVHENCSITYFKHAVFALRYWFRLYDMEEMAIQMPPVKKDKKLPVVLSKQECKELFKAPRSPQKHQTRLFKRHSHQNPPFGSVNPGSAGTYIEAPQATLRSSPICWWQLFFISV